MTADPRATAFVSNQTVTENASSLESWATIALRGISHRRTAFQAVSERHA
ncbi:hypothetical protein Rcae01_01460 [Novipirellula caenicola]|uniref:Uncharacterized protein n=1 Tax=Novipirellula caenicola TaxID=1536901 RepID=A0ABP9VLC7_9BACT